MPHFLNQCFKEGAFYEYFKKEETLIKWVENQKLEMFFEDQIIVKSNIIDLASTGDVKQNIAPNLEALTKMIKYYINILEVRNKIYPS